MRSLIPPHGGVLNPRLLRGKELTEKRKIARELKKVEMNSKETSDTIMLAMGAFSPLDGFVTSGDYKSIVEDMVTLNGVVWPIPITLAVTKDQAKEIKEGEQVALIDDDTGETMGMMTVKDKYVYDKRKEAINIFRTVDENHPGVKKLYSQGDVYLGGPVEIFSEGIYPQMHPEYASPEDTRKIFGKRGWKTVAAFQTRNPIHRSHEYLIRIAMEICDGVFIHPIVGALKSDDIPAAIRMKCYNVLLDKYLPKENVVLKVYPMEMRYAGPREAVLHAIIRQNFGCSHMIIGRDHAGVGKYYGPFDAQKIFDEIKPRGLYIKPLKIDWTFWCYKCEGMSSLRTCPHENTDRLLINGTELRKLLSEGRRPPAEYSRPEILDILIDFYKNG